VTPAALDVGKWIDDLLADVASLDAVWILLLAAGLAATETALFADLIVPGEVGLVLLGAAVAQSDVPLVAVIAAAAVGATIGDSVSFALGRTVGLRLIRRWGWLRRHVEPSVERGEAFFERHGGVAVFLARWVGALRAVVPFVAGVVGMPFGRFLAWNVAASVLWTATVLALGYQFGESIVDVVDRFGAISSLVVIGAIAAWLVWRRLSRREDSGEPSAKTGNSAEPRL
jgi:undecaprenyl-diphosphatase